MELTKTNETESENHMKTMNQNQQRYAMQRVREIGDVKRKKLKEKHTKTKPNPTDKQLLRLLKQGEFEVKRRTHNLTLKTPLRDAITFYLDDIDVDLDEKSYKKDSEILRKSIGVVTDAIMLGDSDNATSLLKKFET